ncbi:hypothetical protein B4U80_10036 [Leptotrombidium deliense]|uniref:Major facilitator superfamily (MFS) profile domain-containing protein n=1 Tax=Leptotrombidium deliense TaxID=299467 RepID=A0A443RUC6_9ACAR|nr:hypothetical protein B4U80_10036 [Leptotrombidium deliense]
MCEETNITLIFLYLTSFTTFMSASLSGPFFPSEAENKGLTLTFSGFVFSAYGAALIVFNIFISKLLLCFGIRKCFIFGLLILSISNIIFGLLDFMNDSTLFAIDNAVFS